MSEANAPAAPAVEGGGDEGGYTDLDSLSTDYVPAEDRPAEAEEPAGDRAETPEGEQSADPKTKPEPEKAEGEESEGEEKSVAGDDQDIEVKVDGEVKKMTLRELKQFYSRNASENLNRKINEKQKQLEQTHAKFNGLVDNLRKDPNQVVDFIRRLGHDPEKLAVSFLEERLQYQKMDPEQRRAYEERQELAKLKQEREEYMRRAQAQRKQQEVQDVQAQMHADWSREIQALGIEPTPDNIRTAAVLAQKILDEEGQIRPSHAPRVAKMLADFIGQYRQPEPPPKKEVAPKVTPDRDKSGKFQSRRRESKQDSGLLEDLMDEFGYESI